jgi:hypothetical protein
VVRIRRGRVRGSDYVRDAFKVEPSPLGVKVADILRFVVGGLHHGHATWEKVDWANPRFIRVVVSSGWLSTLATVDTAELTYLVVLCHDAMVRLEVSPTRVPLDFDGEFGDDASRLYDNFRHYCEYDPVDFLGTPSLALMFHQRTKRTGSLWERHPTLEDAAESVRAAWARHTTPTEEAT